jgi:prephenate dehydrogenase
MKGIGTSITAEKLAVATTRRAIIVVFLSIQVSETAWICTCAEEELVRMTAAQHDREMSCVEPMIGSGSNRAVLPLR